MSSVIALSSLPDLKDLIGIISKVRLGRKKLPAKLPLIIGGVLAALIFVLDVRISLGVSIGTLYLLVMLTSAMTVRQKQLLGLAALCALLTILGFHLSPTGVELWHLWANRVLSLFAIGTMTLLIWRYNRMVQVHEARLSEVQAELATATLSGVLVFCAWCKKIQENEDSWTQIDVYLERVTELELTAGICPDCFDEAVAELRHSRPDR